MLVTTLLFYRRINYSFLDLRFVRCRKTIVLPLYLLFIRLFTWSALSRGRRLVFKDVTKYSLIHILVNTAHWPIGS